MTTEDKRIDQLDPVSVLDLTSLLAMQQGTEARKVTLEQILTYLNSMGNTGTAVLFVAQELTEAQKAQARVNIRCGSVGEVSNDCVASGNCAHAEGIETQAIGSNAHSEGYNTKAEGVSSHAEGYFTRAIGVRSHAEGESCYARGIGSHAEGCNTTVAVDFAHVQGKYNEVDTEAKYAHIVGNGTDAKNRSNAHTLDWDGNAWYAGSVEGTAMILKSPGGKRFSIAVNDSGALTVAEIV